jgi:hypothetical protein
MNELDPTTQDRLDRLQVETKILLETTANLCDTNDIIFREIGKITDSVQLSFRTLNGDRQRTEDFVKESVRAQRKLFILAWVSILVATIALIVALF